MLTLSQQGFLSDAVAQAKQGGHIFPMMAACEAALESDYGTSELARLAHNLFGEKQQLHPVFGTVHLPTREYQHGAWIEEEAAWCSYPDYATCFSERMNTLIRLRHTFPAYDLALNSLTPETYVTHVSVTWSTDPERAAKCIAIYHDNLELLQAAIARAAKLA